MSTEARRQREMEKARAAGLRRLQQTQLAQEHTREEIARRAAAGAQEPNIPSDPHMASASSSSSTIHQHSSPFTANSRQTNSTLQRHRPMHMAHDAYESQHGRPAALVDRSSHLVQSPHSPSMDLARAWASEHQLRDGFSPRGMPHARTGSSGMHAHPQPSSSSSSSHMERPLRGRSQYDFRALLAARQAQRDARIAAELEEQEREEQQRHLESMRSAMEALTPFPVTIEWKKKWQKQSHAQQCGICLDEFRLSQLIIQLPCSHVYHSSSCLQPWLERQSVCPMCRYNIKQWSPPLTLGEESEFRL